MQLNFIVCMAGLALGCGTSAVNAPGLDATTTNDSTVDAAHAESADATRVDVALPFDAASVVVVPRSGCPPERRVGRFRVVRGDGNTKLRVTGELYNQVPRIHGPARRTAPPCAFINPFACMACGSRSMCDYNGVCRSAEMLRTDVRVLVAAQGQTETFMIDANDRRLQAELPTPLDNVPYTLTVVIPDVPALSLTAVLPTAFPGPFVPLRDLAVERWTGACSVAWPAAGDGSLISIHLRANHHVGVGFTECRLPESDGAIVVAAEVADPLRPTTGLEGGTIERVFLGAAETPWGCIELGIASQAHLSPEN